MYNWVSPVFALVIAVLGFAFLAVTFSPYNIGLMAHRNFSRASIALLVIIILVAIGWGVWHHYWVRNFDPCRCYHYYD